MIAEVAITGVGMVASVGRDPGECFAALHAGRSGWSPLQAFDRTRYRIAGAYEILDRPNPPGERTGRASAWLTAAIEQAVAQAGLDEDERRSLPVLVGTGLRELRSLELWWAGQAPLAVNRLHFGTVLAESCRIGGPVTTLSNACAASSFALALAADQLALGHQGPIVVAGCDSLTESMVGMADRATAEAPDRLRPFDRERKGVLLGEGAAAVVLESAGRARQRPLGWLRGVGLTCDAHHETAPSVKGIAAAMVDAHQRSGLTPDQIDVVFAHGTGTALNDPAEAAALKAVFGPLAASRPITAIKSMTGHTSGASGLMSLIIALQSLASGRIPPVAGLGRPCEGAEDLDLVVQPRSNCTLRLAEIHAFGFGGVNAVAVVERGPS